ncbi:oligosaccharide flippase family protein [Methanococcoides sp. SA1]|nr:oligosaccharide flippase family protein [Methanococcoides sp. SA1]
MIYAKKKGGITKTFAKLREKKIEKNTKQVMKNSSYQIATNLIAKFGSLIFTIIVARMMGIELFGIYTLALSTIILFSSFSDFGITTAMITFISRNLGNKRPEKARAYFNILLKYKTYLLSISIFLLLIVGFLLTKYYYEKPIYIALVAGVLYMPSMVLVNYISSTFQASNNFKIIMVKEVLLQVIRFTLVPLGIFYLLKTSLNNLIIAAMIILIIGMCYFFALIYLWVSSKIKINFLSQNAQELNAKEKEELRKFILPLSFTAISGMFFANIDMLMLGRYVEVQYIGLYGAAFALIGAAVTIIGFLPSSVFPIFSRIKGKELEIIFSRTRILAILIGIPAMIVTIFIAKYVLLIYGKEFVDATIFLQIFSILLITAPLAGLYDNYFISRKKTKLIAKLLVGTTIFNIVFNFVFIRYGLQFGMNYAVMGACVATILSRSLYLGLLITLKSRLK